MASIKGGYVYFVRSPANGFIKIGHTSGHPSKRLDGLLTSSPVELEPLGVMGGSQDDERRLHALFARSRRHREWFEPTEDLLAFIKEESSPWPDLGAEIVNELEPVVDLKNHQRLKRWAIRLLTEEEKANGLESEAGDKVGLEGFVDVWLDEVGYCREYHEVRDKLDWAEKCLKAVGLPDGYLKGLDEFAVEWCEANSVDRLKLNIERLRKILGDAGLEGDEVMAERRRAKEQRAERAEIKRILNGSR